jgi:Flp pilus assembly protein protease CpaA
MFDSTSVGLYVCFAALLAASLCDLRTREVPDWISFCLAIFAMGFSILLSVFHQNIWFFVNALAGFLLGLILGFIMFYTGQWGGGDSKLVIGVCAILGFSIPGLSSIESQFSILAFFANTLIVGAAYGIIYSLGIAATKARQVSKEAHAMLKAKNMIVLRTFLLVLLIGSIIYKLMSPGNYLPIILLVISISFIVMFYTWVLVTCVEKAHMIRMAKTNELTEGDWITKPVMKDSKVILTPPKTGLSLEDIALLKKNKIQEVEIKVGIPFVPSFLLAFILTIALGNWLLYLL